jgi:hypothetical protein
VSNRRGFSNGILAALVLGAACRPSLDDRPWLVETPRIIGWKAEPPEAAPGDAVTFQVVALGPDGALDTTGTTWTLCRAPKPLGENRVVTTSCLPPAAASPMGDALGDPVTLAIPTDACRLFGPDTPQPAAGDPPTRPRDPDATGGYFQPLTMSLGASLAVGLERLTCGLPDASLAAARAFQAAYHPNQNPALSDLVLTSEGTPVDPAATAVGTRVLVQAAWPAGTAEAFPVFDPSSGAVIPTEETLRASWYVTGGQLDQPATEIDDASILSTSTTWTLPRSAGVVELVLVLADSRGGSDATRATVTVTTTGP